VARRFGVHHSTVRRVLEDDTQSEQPASKSNIELFKPCLVERQTALPELTAPRLILELRDRGSRGSIAVVRHYVAKVRLPRSRKVYLRIETDPGQQSQVDWGHVGHMRVGGAQRPVSADRIATSRGG
jgi:transposase